MRTVCRLTVIGMGWPTPLKQAGGTHRNTQKVSSVNCLISEGDNELRLATLLDLVHDLVGFL